MSSDDFFTALPYAAGAAAWGKRQQNRRWAEDKRKWNDLVDRYNALLEEKNALQDKYDELVERHGKVRASRLGARQGAYARDSLMLRMRERGQLQATREEAAALLKEMLDGNENMPDAKTFLLQEMKDIGIPEKHLDAAMKELRLGDGPDDLLSLLFPEVRQEIEAREAEQQRQKQLEEEQRQLQEIKQGKIDHLYAQKAQLEQEIQNTIRLAEQKRSECDGDPDCSLAMETVRKGLGKKFRVGERLFSIRDAAVCYQEEQHQLRDEIRQLHAYHANLTNRLDTLDDEIQYLQSLADKAC